MSSANSTASFFSSAAYARARAFEPLSAPLTMTRLSSWGFPFDVAVAADVKIPGARDDGALGPGTQGGLSFGIRAGDAFWPGDREWDVPGGPDLAVRGLYLRGMVGGWAR